MSRSRYAVCTYVERLLPNVALNEPIRVPSEALIWGRANFLAGLVS